MLQAEVLSFQGFSKSGEPDVWDSEYTAAADIFQRLQTHTEPSDSDVYDDREYFMDEGLSFEPSKSTPPVALAGDTGMFPPLLKVEEVEDQQPSSQQGVTIVSDTAEVTITGGNVDEEKKPIIIKSEEESAGTVRGRESQWLKVLDARIAALLRENLDPPTVSRKGD